MDTIALPIILVIAAYLLGSINSAILVSQAIGLPDPRTSGSGNPGATNVLRSGNKFAAVITLLGDVLKGFIPVIIANGFIGDEYLVAMVGLVALLGHMYSIYYGFQGGKGVATALGVLLGINWLLGLLWMIIWLTIALLFRYSSLAALLATSVTMLTAWFWPTQIWIPVALTIMTALIFWQHRNNIKHLRAGTESKIGGKNK